MKILLIAAIVIITLIFVAVLLVKVLGPSVKANKKEQQISNNSQVFKARVISLMDTGKRQERHPEVTLQLEIQPDIGDHFEVKVTTFVSVYQLSKLMPNSMISVKYDPQFPNSVVILNESN